VVPQNPSDQHDTVVLGLPEAADAAGLPGRPTVVETPHRAPACPQAPAASPAGWQAVAGWRDMMVQQAPTAWSQVPPFIPSGPPVLVMRNNAAVVGATLGSVALFLSLLPLIGIVAWVLAPIGLVTSAAGLFVGMARKVGRVGALWGMATSGLALVICVAWTALLFAL
jgi:hypothetical protein